MKPIHSIIALSLIVVACTTNEIVQKESKEKQDLENELTSINPLSIDPGAEVYAISATSADTIFAPTGSSVVFEANSFVDSHGNPIKGEVKIEWQEFHTLGDIIASGIPMKYDSAGVAYDLESGGMFTINATHQGNSVDIAPGKKAKVNLASIQDTPCYNFYKLDEKSGDWDYKTTDSGEKVEDLGTNEPAQSKATIFDVELNTAKFPELNELDLVGWKTSDAISSGEKSWIESAMTMVRLIEKKEDGTYLMEAKSKETSMEVQVTPYDMLEAIEDSRTNERNLNSEVDELVAYAKNVAAGKVIRSIDIAGFGTYNWDIINKRENSLPLFASFEYPDGTNASLVTLRLISPDENVVVEYNPEADRKFSFDPEKRNLLIGILPNNEVVAASNQAFDAARSKPDGATHTFTLKKTGVKLSSPSDIMKHMNKLI